MTKLTLGFYTNRLTTIRKQIKLLRSQGYFNPEELRTLREQEGYYQKCVRKLREKKHETK